jgi:phosphatidylglycerol:prolipoprotein diacylglycerol transferase
MFLILMRYTSRPHAKGRAFALFLVMLGIERFLVEFVRAKDDRFLGPFTIAQLISVILIVLGIVLWARRGDRRAVVPA